MNKFHPIYTPPTDSEGEPRRAKTFNMRDESGFYESQCENDPDCGPYSEETE